VNLASNIPTAHLSLWLFYPLPNSYAKAGKADDARTAFESFLKDYELAADARAGIELLKGENK